MNVDSTNKGNKKSLTSRQKAERIMELADDIKAVDIELLDVSKKTSVTEFMVICTGTSDTHANAVAERVAERLREEGIKPLRRNNNRNSDGWMLHDYGDVIFHVMLEEKRQFYDLESLWAEIENDPNLDQT